MNKVYLNENTSIIDLVAHFKIEITNGNKIRCPFHNDKNPSLQLFEETNSYYCFACCRGGDIINFVQHYKKSSFTEALRIIAKIFNLSFARLFIIPVNFKKKQPEMLNSPDCLINDDNEEQQEIFSLFYNNIRLSEIGLEYLRGRGFSDAIINEYHIKSCISETKHIDSLIDNFSTKSLELSGLCHTETNRKLSFFFKRPSIIIPTLNTNQDPIYFMARSIYGNYHYKMFHKPQKIFIKNIRPTKQYIFESVFDAMSFQQLTNIDSVVSINGLSGLKHLLETDFMGKKITMCLDNDNAAFEALSRFKKKLEFDIYNFKELASQYNVNENVKDFNELLMKISNKKS